MSTREADIVLPKIFERIIIKVRKPTILFVCQAGRQTGVRDIEVRL